VRELNVKHIPGNRCDGGQRSRICMIDSICAAVNEVGEGRDGEAVTSVR
jgi:hypothetical protein